MVRPTVLMVFAAALASCGGSIASPDGGPRGETCVAEYMAEKVAGTSCRFSVPEAPACDFFNRGHIGIKVNDTEIVRDQTHANGWDYTDATMATVEIHGPNCDAITASPTIPVSIVFRMLLP